MKKRIIIFVAITLVLIIGGVSIFFVLKSRKTKPLETVVTEFIYSENTATLKNKITTAEALYRDKVDKDETRLTRLKEVIDKLDTFEHDLTIYLNYSDQKPSSTKSLVKQYNKLSSSRNSLITYYNEYNTRMGGNINADGPSVKVLYDDIFNKTVNFIYSYNECFKHTYENAFNKVYRVDTIKSRMYSLYNAGVNHLLNTISNNQFTNETLIKKLNKGIVLDDQHNLQITSSLIGGEFSFEAIEFKKYFNKCNISVLIDNFESYYNILNINTATETNTEKLTMHYLKKIINMEVA